MTQVVTPDAITQQYISTLPVFNLNMNSGDLIMSFLKPVLFSSFASLSVHIQSTSSSTTVSFVLTGDIASISGNGMVVSVQFSSTDLNAMKAIEGLTQSQGATAFISFADALVNDTAYVPNKIVVISSASALQVQMFPADTTPQHWARFLLILASHCLHSPSTSPLVCRS